MLAILLSLCSQSLQENCESHIRAGIYLALLATVQSEDWYTWAL